MPPHPTMKAEDLFEPETKQVFSIRTGEFLGYERPGDAPITEKESKAQPERKDPAQLELF